MRRTDSKIVAIDLFSGAGGLSLGLQQAGVHVAAGIDLDPACEYPYEHNLGSEFRQKDVASVAGAELMELWGDAQYRLLAGCAPCQPFSSHRRGADTSDETSWDLLSHFARLVRETSPHFVTMENVTRLKSMQIFSDFVADLEELGYFVEYGTLYGPKFGLPQERRRLVLVASRIHEVHLPNGDFDRSEFKTVRQTIEGLRPLKNGESDPDDPLHSARRLAPINLARMEASIAGGTWRDWPEELLAPCHRKASGASFQAFYGRMVWDQPSPTITTQAYNFGTGRFGHPEQHRSLTLREAAMLQGFPHDYQFVRPSEKPTMKAVGRLIGNAVPPAFGRAVGKVFTEYVKTLVKEKA
ncbi:DNA cytosine methyltransferase [Myceligenerans pegani]|uniref:DNA (cytosine-5-)-methyltransferase n=1 Tax=Myceligenerans pegani TaxID=2776917 RepID=A0ABR9N417_9MICO|nr:DNA cytosine methyltransferase [Myceligenerans sp. TRM 65318]MBE1877854.1 DNA cytosine methyltransferase [Myceligenerans sp. TRM 65318]MBE3020125.1 DNA cytosine methyltransferase [Myceligenerans sp. TRM 65318]